MRLLGEVSKLLRKLSEEEIVESIRESREDELSADASALLNIVRNWERSR